AGVGEQPRALAAAVRRHPVDVEALVGGDEARPLGEDRAPREPGLVDLEHEALEEPGVVGHREAVLAIVIRAVERVAPGDLAVAHSASRCTVSGENAGRHTAMYSAPPGSGELYCTHSPRCETTACPARTSRTPPRCFTRRRPRSTTVNSSKAGVWPGSTHPSGLCMWATLTASVFELTRPT